MPASDDGSNPGRVVLASPVNASSSASLSLRNRFGSLFDTNLRTRPKTSCGAGARVDARISGRPATQNAATGEAPRRIATMSADFILQQFRQSGTTSGG
eukprot:scaffold84687_cov57-Phaeocystis_antarctica.AAC.1